MIFGRSPKDEEIGIRHRVDVDTIRRVFSRQKKKIKKSYRLVVNLAGTFIGIIAVLGLAFFGAVGAHALKDKTDVLKMFKQGKYLVIFQNNSEMRPTGGFIGSFALITFSDYKIQKIDFNTNIYKLDDAFNATNVVKPPEPLAIVSHNNWAMRDANFAVDYPTTAQTIQWFYEKESGDKVDGVLAMNASVIQDLMKLTGPIDMPKYNATITSDNFFEELAQKIEKEYFYDSQTQVQNEPKTILKDMMPILMSRAFSLPKTQIIKFVNQEINQKQILLQANDTEMEKAILQNNWGGQVQASNSDYLAVNNANITDLTMQKNGGGKTSLKIKESINYKVDQTDGGLVGNLSLTRSHIGSYAWPDGVNINWTRVLVPNGSTLVKAELNGKDIKDQIEVASESGKTTYGLWINTAPQTSNVLNLSYKLPITGSNYHLLVQKQPGNLGDSLQATFGTKVLFSGILNTDQDIKLEN